MGPWVDIYEDRQLAIIDKWSGDVCAIILDHHHHHHPDGSHPST